MDYNTLIPAIISAVSVIAVGFITCRITYMNNQSSLKEQKIREKRQIISQQLNEFYGPLMSYINTTKALYQILKSDKPNNFRTLEFILESHINNTTETHRGLSDNDSNILKEIISVESNIEQLIIDKGGLIDDQELMFYYEPDPTKTDVDIKGLSLLSIAITHFRVLKLAFDGKIKTEDLSKYKNFVYPTELNDKIFRKIRELKKELDQLNE